MLMLFIDSLWLHLMELVESKLLLEEMSCLSLNFLSGYTGMHQRNCLTFGKYAYLVSCRELDDKLDTTLMFVQQI